jgi:telomere length regulation protein
MDTAEIIETLGTQPSEHDLKSITKQLVPKVYTPGPDTQRILTTLLTNTLPALGPTGISPALVDLFAALPGLSALLFNIRNLIQYFETKGDYGSASGGTSDRGSGDNELIRHYKTTYTAASEVKLSIRSQLEFLLSLLSRVLRRTSLGTVYARAGSNRVQQNEISAVFAGSSLFSLVAQCRFVLNQHATLAPPAGEETSRNEPDWYWMSEKIDYGKYLARSMLSKDFALPDLVFYKGLRLFDSTTDFLEWFFETPTSLKRLLKDIYPRIRPIEQKTVFTHYIIPFVEMQLLLTSGIQVSPAKVALLLNLFIPNNTQVKPVLSQLVTLAEAGTASQILQQIIVVLISLYPAVNLELFKELLDRWSMPLNIKHFSVMQQRAQTQLLILWVPYLSQSDIQSISLSAEYLNAISNHLSAVSEQSRYFGMALAEYFSREANNGVKPIYFGVDKVPEMAYFKELIDSVNKNVTKISSVGVNFDVIVDEYFKELNKKPSEIPGADKEEEEIDVAEAEAPDSDDEDSDDDHEFQPYAFDEDDVEDSDDDPTIAKRERITAPVYIKDLLAYLNDDSNLDKVELALRTGSELIQRKAKFGRELKFHAPELATTLAGLRLISENDDELEDTKSLLNLRLEMLATLVACEPFTVPPHLSTLLVTGDYSLMQRMVILSAVTLGAKYLSEGQRTGADKVLASKRLPSALHDKFANTRHNSQSRTAELEAFNMKQLQDVTLEVQRELTQTTAERAQDELIGGARVLKLSSTLRKQRQGTGGGVTATASTSNLYAKLAAKHFFFPLLNQFLRLTANQRLRIASGASNYNELFLAHYIKSLALLVHYACPTSTELEEMCDELVRLVLSQRTHATAQDSAVQEALYTVVLTVLRANSGERIAVRWPREVCMELRAWLEDTWETVADPRVRGLAASALFQIAEIGRTWERRLVGEMMALENDGGREIKLM